MPNRDLHRPTSTIAGGIYAGCRARRRYRRTPQPLPAIVVESTGGIVGGWLGGILPDVIDPPTSPDHRNFGHGMATVAGVIALSAESIIGLQEMLRERADAVRANRWRLATDFERTMNDLLEYFLRFLAGALDGLLAGYVTHLALDLGTPRGLPIICRQF